MSALPVLVAVVLSSSPAPPSPAAPQAVASPAKTPAGVPALKKAMPRKWADANVRALQIGRGSVEVCNALSTPVSFLPYVGFIASLAFELICLVPGAITADYVNRFHGDHDGTIWQAFVALAAHKLIRDAFMVVALVGLSGLGVMTAVIAASVIGVLAFAVSPVALFYLPVAIAGVLSLAGGLFGMVRNWLKQLADFAFGRIYVVLTPRYADEKRQAKDQRNSLIRPRFNIVERTFLLASSTEVDSEPRLVYAIPVVGAVVKAQDQARVQKDMMRRLAVEEFHEPKRDLGVAFMAIDTLAVAEGALLALSSMATMVGTAVTVAGASVGLYQLAARSKDPRVGLVGFGFGVAGVVMAGAGLALLGVREIPKRLRPLVLPLAFGVLPEGEWFPSRDHEEAVPAR